MAYIESLDEFVAGIDPSGQDYAVDLANNNGGIEGSSGNEGYSSSISGVINLAGALHTLNWIDATDLTPVVSCHGTEDETVPDECGTILNSPNNLTACGSMAIHPIISNYGASNNLLVYEGAEHVPWDLNAGDKEEMINFVTSFVYEHIDCTSNTSISDYSTSREILFKKDILGREVQPNDYGIIFNIYDDGTVDKQYLLNSK